MVMSILTGAARTVFVMVASVVLGVYGSFVSLYYCIMPTYTEPDQFSLEDNANRLMLRKRRVKKRAAPAPVSRTVSKVSLRRSHSGAPPSKTNEVPRSGRARAGTVVDFCKTVATASKRIGAQMAPTTITQSARKRFFTSDAVVSNSVRDKSTDTPTVDGASASDRPSLIRIRTNFATRRPSLLQSRRRTIGKRRGILNGMTKVNSADQVLRNSSSLKSPALRVPAAFIKAAGVHTQTAVRGTTKTATIATKAAVRGTTKTATIATKAAVRGTVVTANAVASATTKTLGLVPTRRAAIITLEVQEGVKDSSPPMLGRRQVSPEILDSETVN